MSTRTRQSRRAAGVAPEPTERRTTEATLERNLERFVLLADTASMLLRAPDPRAAVPAFCARVMEHLGCQVYFNFLVDEEAGRLRLNACGGIPGEEAHRIEWLEFGTAVCGCVARDGVRIVAERIPETPDRRTDLVRSYGVRAYACHPLLGPSGLVIGTLSFGTRGRDAFDAQDVALMQAVADLLAVALARARGLEELQRTTADLIQSNMDLEEFAYVSSHDLREPLRMVSGFVSLLQARYGEQLDEMGREFARQALLGTARMRQLIDDLLDYSRSARGERQLAAVPAREALDAAVQNLAGAIAESGAEIAAEELPQVTADRAHLTVVFQNLLDNAIKYRSAQPPRVHVAARRAEGHWVFSVRDNGIGIPAEQYQRVFVVFQRLHNGEHYPGTGVGLAIVKRIVEGHGGRVWIESAAGQGSTFFFSLPA